MGNGITKTRVRLDGKHSLDVSINEISQTVVAELVDSDEAPTFIYAEKFDAPCNYLRAAIKKGIVYLNGDAAECGSRDMRAKLKRNIIEKLT